MKRWLCFLVGAVLMVGLSSCSNGNRDPVSSSPEEENRTAGKLTVSATKAGGSCELCGTFGRPSPGPSVEGDLIAKRVSASPQVDGVAGDTAWEEAETAELKSGLTLKAVHDGTTLSVLATWSDETMSMTRGGSWTWDGSAWSTEPSAGQGEDRLGIMWDINATGFETQGCGVKCHVPKAYLENAGERADMWHMKGARSLGTIRAVQTGTLTVNSVTHEVTDGSVTLSGYVDDKYVAEDGGDDAGRYGDAGGSTYGRNRNGDKTGPLYIETAPEDYVDAMILRQDEIDGDEVLVLADASAEEVTTAWDQYVALNAVVPERILREPQGSRGDVLNAATWSEGVWTAEFQRALVTGNEDDVQFDDPSKLYLFGVGIFDNSGGMDKDMSNALNSLSLE